MRLSSVFKINVLFFTFVFTNLALSSPPNTFDIPLEIEPIGVIASDINGDGVDDLVVDAEDGVGIIIADGQGGFMPPDYLLGEGLIGVADVNEDGFCDIITNRAVILGSANGHWTIGPSHDRVEGFSAISDFDGDGHIDVIVRYGSGSGSFRIYYGDGKGHFIKDTKSYSTYDRFTVGDLNQDGKPDIVMGYYDELYIFLNLGNRNWSDPCEYSLDNEPSIVYRVHQPSLADITGDGIIDIIVGHYWKNDIKLLKGNGDGTFKDFVKIADFGHVGPTATTDFDNDGIFDVVASGYYGENFDGYPNNSLMIVYGDSSEQFDANDSLPFGSVHKDVTTGDFNKDGWEDIAVASWGTNSISILFNDGTGSFSTPSLLFGDYLLEMSADFDSDGYKDIIVSRSYGSYRYLFIAYGKMDGTFEEPKALSHERTSDFVIGYFDEMLTFGVEGNPSRTLDVAYAIYTGYGPRLYVVLNEGSRQWSNPIRAAGNHYMNMMITGDFNEDGYQDIIDSGDPFFKYKIRFLAGNGNGTFQIQDLDVNGVDILAKAEMVDKDQSAVDIDNDGHLDIVAFPKMGTRGCWIGWGKGDGRFDFAWDDRILGRTPPWGIWLADINGDELPDIMDVDSIWLNSGSRLFYNALDFGGKPDDINGDGILDLIKTYRDEGCIEIRLGDGHSGWSPAEVWVHGGRLWGTNVFYGPPDNPVQNVLIRQYTYPWSSILKNISWKQANPWVGTVVIDTCGPRILDYIGPLNPGFTIAPTEFVLTFSEPIDPATVIMMTAFI